MAARLRLTVLVVSNGSRPIRPPGRSNISMIIVGDSSDAVDDWIAERIKATDVCVTSDIPLASRCVKRGARVVSPTGKQWTEANIGNALTGRDIARHLRELGERTRGPAPLSKQERSRFLSVLDICRLHCERRHAAERLFSPGQRRGRSSSVEAIHGGPEQRSNQRPDTSTRDRKPTNRRKLVAAHGCTIPLGQPIL